MTTSISQSNTTESTSTTDSGTYVRISVPEHGSSNFYYLNGSSYTMTSFLRIGDVPGADPTTETGWDIAGLVVGFNDDTRTRPIDDGESTSNTISDVVKAAVDDGYSIGTTVQTALTTFYGETTSVATDDQKKRVQESMKLHYRGGWRDHSDGNRVTTTRGDKVEVIRGNYKMVVLGRRPDQASATGDNATYEDCVKTPVDSFDNSLGTLDHSGGHPMDWNMSPGQYVEISWVKNGTSTSTSDVADPSTYYTWKIVEECVKGDVDTTYHGAVTDKYYGPSVTTQVGWEDAPDTDDGERADGDAEDASIPSIYRENPGLNRENPTITENTWAKSITTYAGSSKCWVDSVTDYTYAKDITTKRMGDDISDTDGDPNDYLETMTVRTYVKHYEEDYTANYASWSYHGGDFREAWWGHFGEMFMGAYESLKFGNFIDFRAATSVIEFNASVLPYAEMKFSSVALEYTWAKFAKFEIYMGASHSDIKLCPTYTEYQSGVEVNASNFTSLIGFYFYS